jgi:TolB-like protein
VQPTGVKKESRLAVLEFSGPLDDAVRMMLSDEVRGVALKAVAEHHCSVMTRESMAVILKDMGRECKEGDCEVETARNIGADFVVSGIVAKIEGSFVATLKLHETARGSLLASVRTTAPTALDLIEAIKRSSAELFR